MSAKLDLVTILFIFLTSTSSLAIIVARSGLWLRRDDTTFSKSAESLALTRARSESSFAKYEFICFVAVSILFFKGSLGDMDSRIRSARLSDRFSVHLFEKLDI